MNFGILSWMSSGDLQMGDWILIMVHFSSYQRIDSSSSRSAWSSAPSSSHLLVTNLETVISRLHSIFWSSYSEYTFNQEKKKLNPKKGFYILRKLKLPVFFDWKMVENEIFLDEIEFDFWIGQQCNGFY